MMSIIAVIPGRILNQLTSPLKSVGERVGQQLLEEYGLFCHCLYSLRWSRTLSHCDGGITAKVEEAQSSV
jgi:hypothetical protein